MDRLAFATGGSGHVSFAVEAVGKLCQLCGLESSLGCSLVTGKGCGLLEPEPGALEAQLSGCQPLLLGKVLRASLLPLAVEWGHFSSQARGEELTAPAQPAYLASTGSPLPSGVSNERLPCRQAALETSPCSPATVSSSHTTCGYLQCPVSCASHTDNKRGAVVPPCGCGNSSKVTQPGFSRAKTSHPASL